MVNNIVSFITVNLYLLFYSFHKLNPASLHYVQSRLEALHKVESLLVGAPVAPSCVGAVKIFVTAYCMLENQSFLFSWLHCVRVDGQLEFMKKKKGCRKKHPGFC